MHAPSASASSSTSELISSCSADKRASLSACGTARPASVSPTRFMRRSAASSSRPTNPRSNRPSTGAAHRRQRDAERVGERLHRALLAVRVERAQRLDLRERQVQFGDRVERPHVRRAHEEVRERRHVPREGLAVDLAGYGICLHECKDICHATIASVTWITDASRMRVEPIHADALRGNRALARGDRDAPRGQRPSARIRMPCVSARAASTGRRSRPSQAGSAKAPTTPCRRRATRRSLSAPDC